MGKSLRKKRSAAAAATEAQAPEPTHEGLTISEIIRRMNKIPLSSLTSREISATVSEAKDFATDETFGSGEAAETLTRQFSPWEEISDTSSGELVYTPSNDEDSLDRTPAKDLLNSETVEKGRREFNEKCMESSRKLHESAQEQGKVRATREQTSEKPSTRSSSKEVRVSPVSSSNKSESK